VAGSNDVTALSRDLLPIFDLIRHLLEPTSEVIKPGLKDRRLKKAVN